MAGQIKNMLDQIIAQKAQGDPIMEKLTRTKLLVKGIRVDNFDENSEDDPQVIQKVEKAANDFGVTLAV